MSFIIKEGIAVGDTAVTGNGIVGYCGDLQSIAQRCLNGYRQSNHSAIADQLDHPDRQRLHAIGGAEGKYSTLSQRCRIGG